MKVMYIGNSEGFLIKGNTYYVISIEYGKNLYYRILNEDNIVGLLLASNFKIIDNLIQKDYVFLIRESNFKIVPKEISYDDFWENYYNDAIKEKELFYDMYSNLLINYDAKGEVFKMINRINYQNVYIIVDYIIKTEDKGLIENLFDKTKEIIMNNEMVRKKYDSLTVVFKYFSIYNANLFENLYVMFYEYNNDINKELLIVFNDHFIISE